MEAMNGMKTMEDVVDELPTRNLTEDASDSRLSSEKAIRASRNRGRYATG
jgi:hypothetical protein